jgi:excisionase family DNA binding protein
MKMDFFTVWNSMMSATEDPDSDSFGQLCDRIFKDVYADGSEMEKIFQGELAKIKDPEAKKSLKDAAEMLIDRISWFFFSVGLAVGSDYDVSGAEARAQIDYLRQRIHESGIFPMAAQLGEYPANEVSHPPSPSSNVVGTEEKDQKKGSMPQGDYFTLHEAATWLGVSQAWLYKKVNAGVVPHRKIGRMIRFHQKDIAELMNAHKTGPISPKGHGKFGKRSQDRDDTGEIWLTAKEVAKNLGVSQSWILRKAKCKILPCIKIGGIIRFSEKDVEAWIKAHGIKGALKI